MPVSLNSNSQAASLYRIASARQHRPQSAPREEVDMEVGNLLAAMRADVGKKAVTGLDQLFVAGDPADSADEAGDLGVARMGGKVVPRNIRTLGYDEDVDRRLGVYVVKGEGVLVLIDLLR